MNLPENDAPQNCLSQRTAPSFLACIRQRLSNRPDSEHEMTPNRLAFAAIVSGYLCIATWLGNEEAAGILDETYPVFIGYFILSMAIFAHIVYRPGVSVARRVIAIVHDLAMISFAAQAAGMSSGFFYPLYLWTVFGNGFRFGIPYLYVGMVVALIGFCVALTVANYWATHLGLSIALVAGLVLLPVYVSALIRKLSEAKRQAEEANKAKSLFLASVSHELRTPLNAIIGLSDLLNDQVADREQRDMTRTIGQSGRSLLRLINTLLDFARAEAGQVAKQHGEVDLHAVAAEIRSMLAVQAKKKGIALGLHISARTPATIIADRRILDDVMMNLAANAVKFTDEGFVAIDIDATDDGKGTGRLRVEITDTGIGIAPEAQSRIFGLFTQADETIIDRYGGTGLGLAISKRLVELHGGSIGLSSEPGKGSTFWFEIAIRTTADATGSATVEASAVERALPADRDRSVIVVSRDAALAAGFGSLALPVTLTPGLGEARALIGDLRQRNVQAPVVFVDQAAIRDEMRCWDKDPKSAAPLLDAPAVLVHSGTSALSPVARMLFVSSLSAPLDERAVRAALAIADASTGGSDGSAGSAIRRRARAYSILIAEDNATNQMVIAKILERAGHQATIVGNGEEALAALRDGVFDLVLMDVNMPVMNGIEATKLYRFMSLGGTKRLPIVALTADATPEAEARCREAGMDACALKPIEAQALLDLIDSLVLADGAENAGPAATGDSVTPIEAHPDYVRPHSDPINMATLDNLEALGGGEFVIELVHQFLDEAKDMIDDLERATADLDVIAFRDRAHALRSTAANVGAMSVFNLCLQWRDIGQQELAREGHEHIKTLRDEFDVAQMLLETHLDALETAADATQAPTTRPA